MHRIDAPGNDGGNFVAPDVATGVPGTDLGVEWCEDVQENLCRAIEAAGLTLVKGTVALPAGFDQLADALRILAGRVLTAAQKNLLINPGFDLWQAATTSPPQFDFFSPTLGHPADDRPHGGYTSDQWYVLAGNGSGDAGAATITRGIVNPGQGVAPHGNRQQLVFQQTTARSPGNPTLAQRMELLEEVDGLPLTLSVAMKVASGTLQVTPYVLQNFGSGGSTAVLTYGTAFTVTTTIARYGAQLTPPSISGKTVGAGAYTEFGWEVTGGGTFTLTVAAAQLEFGTVVTDWSMPDLTTDLLRAQRYFFKTYEPGTAVGAVTQVGMRTCDDTGNITLGGLNVLFAVPMRTIPTLTAYSPATGAAGNVSRPLGVTDAAITAVAGTSSRSTGYLQTGGVTAGAASVHVVADARL
jgi:hypothetical protein